MRGVIKAEVDITCAEELETSSGGWTFSSGFGGLTSKRDGVTTLVTGGVKAKDFEVKLGVSVTDAGMLDSCISRGD